MARQWTGTPTQGYDGIWHYPWTDTATGESGEELSYEGPTGTQPQPVSPSAPAGATTNPLGGAPRTSTQYTNYAYSPGNNWYDPATGRHSGWGSVGAGTANLPTGWGSPGWGQPLIQLQPDYLEYLKTAPGYIPGSGTYNQYPLNKPGLVGTVGGVANSNLRYGQGGAGDPTTGLEAQTPDEWVQGGRLFQNNYPSNWGQDDATRGKDFIANLFLRSDTPSGIGTPAWSAPEQYWKGLAEEIASGRITPTERGWAALQAKGYTPQSIGGAGANRPVGAGGGAGGAGGQSGVEGAYASIIAMQQAQIAAQVAYTEWSMRSGDQEMAEKVAQAAWQRTFDEVTRKFAQGVTEAGLTGQYNGAQTQQAQQQQWLQGFQQQQFAEQQRQSDAGNALNLLQQQSALQGPRDAFRYQQLNASTPGGLKDMLAGLAGRYNFAGSGFQGTPGPATLQSRTQDLLAGGQQGTGGTDADGQSQFALPSPNQINLANWGRLSPSGQQLALGAYESQGYYGQDVEEALRRAAPRYTSGGAQAQLTV